MPAPAPIAGTDSAPDAARPRRPPGDPSTCRALQLPLPLPLLFGLAWLLLPALPAHPQAAPASEATSLEFFENRIRPVFVEHCYKCHGPDALHPKGGLRLDSKAGLIAGGDSGQRLIDPDHPGASRLIRALRHSDPDLQMPPRRRLPETVVADFEHWIREGAPDPRLPPHPGSRPAAVARLDASNHWAFHAPTDPPLPDVRHRHWPQTPIDRFILAGLEKAGLQPAPAADRRTLLRRLSYDLRGLPPSPEEVREFERDLGPNAWERWVDRFLDSPRYGERWGRHWLDVARYADTKGYVYYYEESRFVQPHTYRDWVIRAFNEDLPYNRFLELQIAADLLLPETLPSPETTASQGGTDSKGPGPSTLPWPPRRHSPDLAALGFLSLGRRFLDLEPDILDDRIDVLMRGTQALTVGCARCHDHKFDPIPTRDYYSLYGVFLNSEERLAELAVPGLPPPGPEFTAEVNKRIETLNSKFQTATDEVMRRLRDRVRDYLLAVVDVARLPSDANVRPQPEDINPFNVGQWERFLASRTNATDTLFAAWHAFARIPADRFAASSPGIVQSLRDRQPPLPDRILQHVLTPAPASLAEVAGRFGDLFLQAHRDWLSVSNRPASDRLPDPGLEAFRLVLYGPDSPLRPPPGRIVDLDVHLYFDDPNRVALTKLQMELEQFLISHRSAPPLAVTLGDRPHSREAQVFRRGDPLQRGEIVPRQFLEILTGPGRMPFGPGSGRRELARAIASPENPLTARVFVNRVWAQHFGQGLVRTPSDFGLRSEPPTHPELLDWLARRFVDGGWSVKNLHRLILNSAVYQQASPAPETLAPGILDRDPENRLLGRFNRRRLDLEAFRDTLFAVSDDLDPRMGGPAEPLQDRPFSRRRTVYGLIDRRQLPGLVRAFDFANPDTHSPGRHTTTMPQQALFLLNHPLLAERARSLAHRAASAAASSSRATLDDRIDQLYQQTLQRAPSDSERSQARAYLQEPEPASPPSPAGAPTPNPGPPQSPLNAWESLAHVLLVSNELAFVD